MSNSRTPRAKRHGATQMPSKTFQTQNPGGCPACADRPLKTATRPDVLAVSILGSVFGVLGALLLARPELPAPPGAAMAAPLPRLTKMCTQA